MQRKQYKRLRYEDRQTIERMSEENRSVDEIAKAVGVAYNTIYREMSRGGSPYRAEVAQRAIGG